jgi:hypothetical protein
MIAGQALDNNFVYGEFIGLDAPLRTMWNITKNLANFTLGFMVLIQILKNVFSMWEKGKGVFDVIKKAVIAGIGIQASWFMLAALIDISTIATYGIGWLPLTVLTQVDTDIGNQKVLGVEARLDLSNTNQATYLDKGFQYFHFSINNNNEKIYYSPCRMGKDSRSNYIIGRKYGYPDTTDTSTGITFVANRCILYGNYFVVLSSEIVNGATSVSDYDIKLTNATSDTGANRTGRENNGQIIDLYKRTNYKTKDERTNENTPEAGIYALEEIGDSDDFTNTPTLATILDKAEGLMWPLVLVYNSLLNFADLSTPYADSNSDRITFFNFVVKALVAIALFMPLVFVAIILIIRVGYMWLYIIASPFIILLLVFKEKLWSIGDFVGDIAKNTGNILKIIFAPVIIVFALSISVLFLSVLNKELSWSSGGTKNALGFIENNNNGEFNFTIIDKGFPSLSIDNGQDSFLGFSLDPLGWFIMNLFGIAIMWFVVFAALSTIKLKRAGGGEIVNRNFAANTLGSIPIIPIPTQDGNIARSGVNTAGKYADKRVQQIAQLDAGAQERLANATGQDNNTDTSATQSTHIDYGQFNQTQRNLITAAVANGTPIKDIIKPNKTNFENLKNLKPDQIPTEFVSNKERAEQFIKKDVENLKDTAKKQKAIEQQITTFRKKLPLLNADAVAAIFNRGDELAQRVAPLNGTTLMLSDGPHKVEVSSSGHYTLTKETETNATTYNNDYKTLHQEFAELKEQNKIRKDWMTGRNKQNNQNQGNTQAGTGINPPTQ